MNNNSLRMFLLLAVLLVGFILSVSFLGYIWALVFCAFGAGFVLWWSRKAPVDSEE